MSATKAEVAVFEASVKSFPDFVIRIDGYQWHVHSNVISQQSKFFLKACNGPFKESTEKIITLYDDCPWTVARMVRWFYTGGYEPHFSETPFGPNSAKIEEMMQQGTNFPNYDQDRTTDQSRQVWQRRVLLYKLADKYTIEELASTIGDDLSTHITNDPGLFWDIIEYIDASTLQNDKVLCEKLLNTIFHCRKDTRDLYDEIKADFGDQPSVMEIAHQALIAEVESRLTLLDDATHRGTLYADAIKKANEALGDDDDHDDSARPASPPVVSAWSGRTPGPLFPRPSTPPRLRPQPERGFGFGLAPANDPARDRVYNFFNRVPSPESRIRQAKKILKDPLNQTQYNMPDA